MKTSSKHHVSWLLAAAITLFSTTSVWASVAVTPATGGTNISADKAANAASPAYTTLGDIKIVSQNDNDFPKNNWSASIALTAPAGWEFKANTGSGSVSGDHIGFYSMSVTTSLITFYYYRENHNSANAAIIISGIQVRCKDGNVLPDTARILKTQSSQTIIGFPNGTTMCMLSQVVGAPAKLAITAPPSTLIPAPAAFTGQPAVALQDQFGNPTGGTATVTASDNGSATLQGNVTVQAVNGIAEFTDLAYGTGGTYSIAFALGSSVVAVSAPFTVPVPLPVELTSFTAAVRNGSILLSWETATEKNNAGFEVQRRSGCSAWAALGYIDGNGTSNAQHAYSFKDAALAGGTYTYRLKQMDRDGAFEYSKEVEASVALRAEDYTIAQNYPNPFNPTTNIRFAVPVTQNVSVKVFNVIGQQVADLFNGLAEAGVMHSVRFDAAGLASGTYIYQLKTAEKTEVKRMLLVR
jgi:hypothetical protein